MIASPLQKKYREVINMQWIVNKCDEIFIDFYKNLNLNK